MQVRASTEIPGRKPLGMPYDASGGRASPRRAKGAGSGREPRRKEQQPRGRGGGCRRGGDPGAAVRRPQRQGQLRGRPPRGRRRDAVRGQRAGRRLALYGADPVGPGLPLAVAAGAALPARAGGLHRAAEALLDDVGLDLDCQVAHSLRAGQHLQLRLEHCLVQLRGRDDGAPEVAVRGAEVLVVAPKEERVPDVVVFDHLLPVERGVQLVVQGAGPEPRGRLAGDLARAVDVRGSRARRRVQVLEAAAAHDRHLDGDPDEARGGRHVGRLAEAGGPHPRAHPALHEEGVGVPVAAAVLQAGLLLHAVGALRRHGAAHDEAAAVQRGVHQPRVAAEGPVRQVAQHLLAAVAEEGGVGALAVAREPRTARGQGAPARDLVAAGRVAGPRAAAL
mmetsp:Transcript_72324/g.212246  ORF Transcript_72324/g.212246 Transcript_72324/m.212246 type:complete len:392 (-) Transcript_72324:475-1650(-)